MFNKILIIFVCILTAATVSVFAYYNMNNEEQVKAESEDVTKNSSITVQGRFTERVKPDIAYINIQVNTENKNAQKAQDENDQKMNEIIVKVKNIGVNEKDIKTLSYNMHPVYEWEQIEEKNSTMTKKKSEKVLKGYEVMNSIRVTVRNLDNIGRILDLAIEEGVTKTNMVSFDLSDNLREEVYIEALKKATKNAQKKAEGIASVYNVNLDKPKIISENGINNINPVIHRDYSEATKAYGKSDVPIESGELEINANVTVTYEY